MGTTYIISRARPGNVRKLLTRWGTMGFNCIIVMDPGDPFASEYMGMAYLADHTEIVTNRYVGVGGARATAVEHAAEQGHASIVMSDDDIAPAITSDYEGLLRVAEHRNALGVGAYVDYHSFALKGHLERLGLTAGSGHEKVCAVGDDGFICPSGIAFRMFGINIANARKLVNGKGFDPTLTHQNEDGEFQRQGVALLRLPWLLYPQAKATSIGARYATGGVVNSLGIANSGDSAAVANHPEVQRIWAEVHRRWPTYVNAPGTAKGIRTKWSKMLNDYIPDWRDYSALHGAEKTWKDMP